MKKLLVFSVTFIIIFMCGCSKESKFGVQQLVERMNTTFETDFRTEEFLLSKDDNGNSLFLTRNGKLILLSLDNDNNIKGISLLITADESIENSQELYCQLCSVFTGNDLEKQKGIFNEAEFFSDKIKFADSNSLITVGRYKYSIICNAYAITFFCDRI